MADLSLLLTPTDVERSLAQRLRAARKSRGWTQEELASRSGLGVATVARLERNGQGQLRSLVLLCAALGRLDTFDGVLAEAPPTSLEELRRRRGSG
jgi:transcriptional regulator with XRE-family HTH domain